MIAIRTLRRPRVLIVGCGDVGLRCVEQLRKRANHPRIFALTHDASRRTLLREAGTRPIIANLDARSSLVRLAGLAPTVLHLTPPNPDRTGDLRTRALIAALCTRRRSVARSAAIVPDVSGKSRRAPRRHLRLVYTSTTGVYGDCRGAKISETHRVQPASERAKRRVCAERQLRRATACGTLTATIARVPGIYAANRLPLARLKKGVPALIEADDVYTSHIHADDLAAILIRMTTHARPARIIHASDDSELKMGDWLDHVADASGIARVPRVSFAQAVQQIDPVTLSFMRESRRPENRRLKYELRIRLRYPVVAFASQNLKDNWRFGP